MEQKGARARKVVGVEKLAPWRPGAPDHDLFFAALFRFVDFPQQRRENVRTREVKIIPGTVEVRRHHADELVPTLARVGLAELDARDLGDRIRVVRRFERAGQERGFIDWLRREFRVDARASEEEKFARAEVVCRFDHVVLDLQIFEQELDRKVTVRRDPTDLGRREHHHPRTSLRKESADRVAFAQVEFRARAGEKIRPASRGQRAGDRTARETAMPGDKNRVGKLHARTVPRRLRLRKFPRGLPRFAPTEKRRLPFHDGFAFLARMSVSRLSILKTYKLSIGGKFPRGESGRVAPAKSADGKSHLANFCVASRKDLRDAVVAARKAQSGWAKTTAYLRGQILYRAAEITEQRSAELISELTRAGHKRASLEVETAIDRLVHFAGWTDKYAQLFSSVNPVASSHFNFTTPEPTGVVGVLCPDAPALLGLVSLLAPVILSGNTAVLLASESAPLAAITFAEILATSDLPGGVVNFLTGTRAELAPHFASHMDINALVDGSGDSSIAAAAQAGTPLNLKRHASRTLTEADWFSARAEDPYWILDTIEFKTAWHPIGT